MASSGRRPGILLSVLTPTGQCPPPSPTKNFLAQNFYSAEVQNLILDLRKIINSTYSYLPFLPTKLDILDWFLGIDDCTGGEERLRTTGRKEYIFKAKVIL